MSSKKTIIVPCYQSLKDPICEGLWLNYLKELGKDFHFVLITQEQSQYALSKQARINEKKVLKEFNIDWYPIRFKSNKYVYIISKVLMFLAGSIKIQSTLIKHDVHAFLGFASLSGGIASIWSVISRKKLVIYCFEPHSQYQIEFGLWKSNSLSYHLLRRLERFQVKHAAELVVPTKFTRELVTKWGTNANISVVPVSVDETLFSIDNEAGIKKRKENRIPLDKTVLLYLGKFDGIYYSAKEVISFYAELAKLSSDYFFLTITPNSTDEINQLFKQNGLSRSSYLTLPPIPYAEINDFINAADLGVLAVPSYPSQRYRTPIKTANYLLCGLPYLVNKGVAEDDIVAQEYNVGIVVENLTKKSAENAFQEIQYLLEQKNLNIKCRKVGLELRKMSVTINVLSKALS